MKTWRKSGVWGSACASAVVLASPALGQVTTATTAVDLELGLVVDVSGSVDASEFALQLDGYVNAFRDQTIIDLIGQSTTGIAVNLVFFATDAIEAVPTTLLTDSFSVSAFADTLAATARPASSIVGFTTDLAEAIDLGASTLANNLFEGSRVTLDVSGDGTDTASLVQASRDAALSTGGVTNINGLPIGDQGLVDFFADNVIGGPSAFNQPATDFASINAAVLQKLESEISVAVPTVTPAPAPAPTPDPNAVPTPGAAAGGLLGLVGLMARRRRR